MADLPQVIGYIQEILPPPSLDEINLLVAVTADLGALALLNVGEVSLKGIQQAIETATLDALESHRLVESLDGVARFVADLPEECFGLGSGQVLLAPDLGLRHEGVGLSHLGLDVFDFNPMLIAKLHEIFRVLFERLLVLTDVNEGRQVVREGRHERGRIVVRIVI